MGGVYATCSVYINIRYILETQKEIYMLEKDGETVAKEFMDELRNKKFTMSRSQNSGEDYAISRQKRDTEAVEAFIKTDLFQDIINLK
jgi:hypothetical protein